MRKIRPIRLIRQIRPIRLIRPIGLIGLIILCLTLVSCGGGGDDDLGTPQTAAPKEEMVPITFNGSEALEATVTRASGTPLSKKAQHFQVWGYKNMPTNETQTVFPCYQVNWGANTAYTTTSNTNNWEYVGIPGQTIKYWDWEAQAYRFFAVTGWSGEEPPVTYEAYEANKTYGTNETNETNEAYEISMLANTADIKDNLYFSRLWYSTGHPTDYPDKQFGKPVTLEFVKPYARVRFIYTYVYPREGVIITSQSFKPSDGDKKIYRKGVVTVKYPLEGTDTKESYSMTPTAASDPEHLEAFTEDYDPEVDTKEYTTCDDGWYTVLPNTSQGSYTLTVNIKGLGERKAVVPATYMQWNAGYSYTYVFKITEEGGIAIGWVEYAVVPWINVPGNRTVYNW